ncbi:hypothetical protein AAK894_09045 [Lachnospiraceae bacterium 46-61]
MKIMEKYCCLLLLLLILFYGVTKNNEQSILQKILFGEYCQKTIEGIHSKVYYKTEKEYAELIQRQADTYYTMIAKDFKWDKKDKINFILFETKEDFISSLFYRGSITMGVYYNGVIGILSPNLWEDQKQYWKKTDDFLEKGPVVHEMIHFVIDDKTKGNCEQFLSEGIALYYEKKYTGFSIPVAKEEIQITKKELQQNFNQLDSSLAYWKSYEWVQEFVECYGESTLQKALQQMAEKCYKW